MTMVKYNKPNIFVILFIHDWLGFIPNIETSPNTMGKQHDSRASINKSIFQLIHLYKESVKNERTVQQLLYSNNFTL